MKQTALQLLLIMISSTTSIAQCDNWTQVQVLEMRSKMELSTEDLGGEAAEIGVNIKTIEDLTEKQLKSIKKNAFKYGGCSVYLDIHNFWGYTNGLYYYWSKQ